MNDTVKKSSYGMIFQLTNISTANWCNFVLYLYNISFSLILITAVSAEVGTFREITSRISLLNASLIIIWAVVNPVGVR